jgi:hypothetical protein
MITLYKWNDLKAYCHDAIILGNGASIAVDKCFTYNSLYQEAESSRLLSEGIVSLFDAYKTKDFEFILRLLWTAHQVNQAFGVDERVIVRAYEDVKDSLIQTVQRIHVSYSNALSHLDRIVTFLRIFPRIMSLNYDLLIYWAMLHGNTKAGGPWFKDGFIKDDRTFQEDYKFLLKPHGTLKGASMVFYPHGNLVLGTGFYDEILKIVSDEDADLLDTIVKRWTFSSCTPLFVSEGTETQKFRAIQRHSYLHFIYTNVLSKLSWNGSFTIYGWSMSDQDQHLLDALGKNWPKRLAISVYRVGDEWEKYCESVEKKCWKTYGLKDTQLLFFDSTDEGVWIH